MQSILHRFNRFFELAPQLLLPWRWWVLAIFLCSTAFMLYGMFTRFAMDMSLESWFQDEDPAKASLESFRKQFGSDDGVYIVYRAKDGDVFSEESLLTLQALQRELDNARVGLDIEGNDRPSLLTRIVRLDSLYNARYQIAEGDTLISQKLIANDFPHEAAERESRRDIAKSQDQFELAYYSKDFVYGGIRLKTDFGVVPLIEENTAPVEDDLLMEDDFMLSDDLVVDETSEVAEVKFQEMQMNEYLHFMNDLKVITEKSDYSNFEFYYSGNAPMMEFAMNNMKQASMLLSGMMLLIAALLWFLFHSLSAVIWPTLVIAAAAFWTIGASSWVGITLSTMVSLTYMLVVAVGIADCVHVLSTYIYYRRTLYSHRDAMTKAYRKTGLPIFLTTITTMAGMSALMLSDIPQIGIFGVTSAVGVFMAFVFTIFVLPVLLDIWHPYSDKKVAKIKAKNSRHWLQPLLDKIPVFVSGAPRTIVVLYFLIFTLFVYGASQVRIDSNFAELTREGSTIRVTFEIVDKNMMGGQNMEILMDFGQADALKDPQVLKAIEAMQNHVEAAYPEYTVKTFSLSDFVKDTHKIMRSGDETYKVIPDDPRLTAQLLYLFDNANPEDRRNLVSDDYSKSHLTIQLKNAGSYEYTQFFESVQKDLKTYFEHLRPQYGEMDVSATGALPLMMKLIDHISWTQLKSFSFALLIITLMMMLTLGSVQAGLISMVPNLLPAFFTFGFMGLTGIALDTDTLIIAPLIIGIAVDDTIHFVAHYRDAWFEHGDVDKALESTLKEVGQAVTFTTLILGFGFSLLSLSDYLGIAKTGIFGSMAIFVALSSDLLLLPALIKWIKPDLGRKKFLEKQQESIEVEV